ncbi:MAG TPA: sulfurtransferase [Puia sp.]
MPEPILISATKLRRDLSEGSPKIIDTRPKPAYDQGHIPGAVNIPLLFTYLLPAGDKGPAHLCETFKHELSKAGIGREDRVIIYENTLLDGFGQSCRGWFILKWMGHRSVVILDGGFAAWEKAGYPVSQCPPTPSITLYQPKTDSSLTASAGDVLEAIRQNGKTVLLDCRDREEWAAESSSPYGRDFCPRKGRIPSSVWLEWRELMDTSSGTPLFRSPAGILALCRNAGLSKTDRIIVYCFKGSRAAAVIAALRYAGFDLVKNYFASWNEWSRDHSLPIDTKPLNQALYQ